MGKKAKAARAAAAAAAAVPITIAGVSAAEARAALTASLDAHLAACEPVGAHAAAAESALVALEARESEEAAERAAARERGADDDGWEVVTYKRKAVLAEPRAPKNSRKKREREQTFSKDADFYKFQLKRQRLGEMRSELDAATAVRRKRAPPTRKFQA